MKNLFLSFFITFTYFFSFAQTGKLLLIGGGSEKDTPNSWNSKAYQWAVNQSTNKKVALIAFGSSTSWLPDYFVNKCGAVSAQNFDISTKEVADLQSTYNDLMNYDVIFLKGGDQYNYYNIYKGTKTQKAIADKFNQGGVICGTSAGLAVLSEVIYTAQNNSALPESALLNPNNSDITLANDLFSFFPNFIFDTHFTIRARFGRLLAFMANWQLNKNEQITGLGVDEMTAMSINANGLGTVYGIGSVNIYKAFSENTFTLNETKLLADSVHVTQLLQNCTYNFNTGEISGFSQNSNPEIKKENGNYTILASGSDYLSENTDFLNDFATQTGQISMPILLLTGNDQTLSNSYKSALNNLGANNVNVFSATSNNASNANLTTAIQEAKKILFISNSYTELFNFLATSNGNLLKAKLLENNMISGFIGDNSRFIGKTVIENYLTPDAAYYGEIILKKGLNLLKTTVIMPNLYKNSDYYENTASALPYSMIYSNLTYGIWLYKNNYIKYSPNAQKIPYIFAGGQSPVLVLKNKNTKSGFSVQTAYGDGQDNPPHFAGFEHLILSVIDKSKPYQIGDSVIITSNIPQLEHQDNYFQVEVQKNNLKIFSNELNYEIKIYNLLGNEVYKNKFSGNFEYSFFNTYSGIFLIHLKTENNKISEIKKIFIP